jgi:D-glycero-D-manno-heptose 1,7-bisphosphate phosphatase
MPGQAIFFDRDGVLNRLVMNPSTGEYESPHSLAELRLTENLGALLRPLQGAGFSLFLVSNQPSAAKGKVSLETLKSIHASLDEQLKGEGVVFQGAYYCYHHPDSLVPELKGPCACRKPSPFFVTRALAAYRLDPRASWMIGDQDSDIACGQAAGVRTILLEIPESAKKRGASKPDQVFPGLEGALNFILNPRTTP